MGWPVCHIIYKCSHITSINKKYQRIVFRILFVGFNTTQTSAVV